MRIAIDAREIVGKPTGVGRYLSQILSAWAKLPAAAAHEFVLCSPEKDSPERWAPLRISSVSGAGAGTVWEQLVLPRLIATARADVLFAPAYTAPLLCPVPFVLMVHDVSFAAHPEWFSWREGLRRRLITRAIAIIPAVIVTVLYGESGTARLLVLSQVVLSLQLSFAVVPLVVFTSDKRKMGEFANPTWLKILAWAITAVIVTLNVKLLVGQVTEWMK